jgi:hypothetical protein
MTIEKLHRLEKRAEDIVGYLEDLKERHPDADVAAVEARLDEVNAQLISCAVMLDEPDEYPVVFGIEQNA